MGFKQNKTNIPHKEQKGAGARCPSGIKRYNEGARAPKPPRESKPPKR